MKVTINHLIILAAMIIFYKVYALKFIYLLIIPGFALLTKFTKYGFNKKLLYSIPLSLILYVYPYFVITRLGLAVNVYLYLLIPLIGLAYLVKDLKLSFDNKFTNKSLLIIIALTIFYLIYSPLMTEASIPLTEAANELRAVNAVRDSVLKQGVVLHWNEDMFGGSQYFYIGPPLTTLTTALLTVIQTEPLYNAFNMTYAVMIMYLMYTSYMLYRKLKLREITSIISAVLTISVPLIVGELIYSGNLTSPYMFSLYPLAIIGFIDVFNNVSRKDLVINAIALSAFFLTYHFMFIFFLYPALIVTLFYLKSKRVFNNSLIYYGIAGLIILSWVVHSVMLGPYVEVMGYEGDWNRPLKSVSEFLHYITYTGEEITYKTVTMTPLFFYAGLIAVILSYRNKKVFLFFLVLLLLILSEISPLHHYIPLRAKFYNAYRFWFALIPLMSYGVGRLIDNLKLDWRVSLLVIVLFSGMMIQSSTSVKEWLSEKSMISEGSFKGLYELIKSRDGRAAEFGIFGPGIMPAINYWTGKPVFAGYNYERYGTKEYYNKLVLPLTKASMDFITDSATPERVYNTFSKAWVNTIFYYTCSDNGFKAANKTIQYPYYQLISQSDCVLLLGLNSPFAEMVYLSNATEAVKNETMNLPDGYRLVYTLNNDDVTYTNNVASLNLTLYKTNSTPVSYKKITNGYLLYARKGYVLVKEAYFPTWHAYQNNKELRIIESYNGLMIINSESANVIKLINKPHPVEYLSLLIFLISLSLIYSLSK